jgi:hypothetical protein
LPCATRPTLGSISQGFSATSLGLLSEASPLSCQPALLFSNGPGLSSANAAHIPQPHTAKASPCPFRSPQFSCAVSSQPDQPSDAIASPIRLVLVFDPALSSTRRRLESLRATQTHSHSWSPVPFQSDPAAAATCCGQPLRARRQAVAHETLAWPASLSSWADKRPGCLSVCVAQFIDRWFSLSERRSNFTQEVRAGTVTFLTVRTTTRC